MGKATKSIYGCFTRRLKNENREFLYKNLSWPKVKINFSDFYIFSVYFI